MTLGEKFHKQADKHNDYLDKIIAENIFEQVVKTCDEYSMNGKYQISIRKDVGIKDDKLSNNVIKHLSELCTKNGLKLSTESQETFSEVEYMVTY